jgi:hypothetical protein
MVPLLWIGLSPQPFIDLVEKGKPSLAGRETAAGPHTGLVPGETLPPGRRK